MATKATKKDHTDVGGVNVPNDMIKQEPGTAMVPAKQETGLAVQDKRTMAEIQQLSNSTENAGKNLPMLKLQHTTTPDGEPNPLRGHFTIVRMNDLGEWDTEDLGENFKMQFLLQRYFLKMMKGDDMYTSGEYENEFEKIALWKRNGDQSELVKEGSPHDLQTMFLEKNDRDQLRSKLQKLSKLYVLVNGEVAVWKLSLTGTIAWSKYGKLVPFTAGVNTAVGRTEEKKGAVKYFAPVFKADSRIEDLQEVKANIQLLRDMLPRRGQADIIVEQPAKDVPFEG